MNKPSILIIGGDDSLVTLVQHVLDDHGYSVRCEPDAESGFENLIRNSYNMVIVHSVSQKRGVPRPNELIRQIKHMHRDTVVLVATASILSERDSAARSFVDAGATRVFASGATNTDYLKELLEELNKHIPQAVA
jgi:DNA-binding NtrC family response regulator